MSIPHVYDKAKYHYEGDFPEDLSEEQAFVHSALYLGWIVDNDLYSDEFAEETDLIEPFKQRKIKATEVYKQWDACLVEDMLSAEGNAFSRFYFDFETGQYLPDYEELLIADLPSLYHVADTWENYDKLAACIDTRYADWKQTQASGQVRIRKG
jgi:hypothetical protein